MGKLKGGVGVSKAKRLLSFLLVVLFAMSLTFASVKIAAPATAAVLANAEPAPSIHRSYREASSIVLATCTLSYRASSGGQMSRFRVDTAYAGALSEGDEFSLASRAVVGQSYLLYLGEGGGANYAEDETGFVCVTDELITVRDGIASLGGVNYSLSAIMEDLASQREVLNVPAQSFYYNNLEDLFTACDDIVIAAVTKVEGPVPTLCRSDEKGESVISTTEQTFVSATVLNGLGGVHSYGDNIKAVFSPARKLSIINATNLEAVSFGSEPAAPKEGEVYIFFLLRSKDAKSDYCFAVNPYQGCVLLEGDDVVRPYYNTALQGISSLEDFAALLNEHMGF